MINIIRLCIEFFLTGLFAVGGGLATIPFLTDMAIKYAWFSVDTLSTMIAISESTPGPIGINMATYVGYTIADLPGALSATLSIVTPSIIVICIIANYFQKFKEAKLVKMIFAGIKPAVVAFIFAACLDIFITTLFRSEAFKGNDILSIFNIKEIILLFILLLVQKKFPKIHPIFYIVSAAFIGIIFSF